MIPLQVGSAATQETLQETSESSDVAFQNKGPSKSVMFQCTVLYLNSDSDFGKIPSHHLMIYDFRIDTTRPRETSH